MKVLYREDKVTKEQMYSGDIQCESKLWGEFSVPLLDVRDGGFEEVLVLDKDEKPKQNKMGVPYKVLQATGVRKEIEEFERRSGRSSKYIPTKKVLEVK